MLEAIKFTVLPHMAGLKTAVKLHGTIYISPAMHDLIKHANQEELEFLLSKIRLLDLDKTLQWKH